MKNHLISKESNWTEYIRLSDRYGFVKPNDRRALDLMNAAAVEVMKELPDLCVAYGVSDEYRYFPFILFISGRDWLSLVSSSTQAVSYSSGGMGESPRENDEILKY